MPALKSATRIRLSREQQIALEAIAASQGITVSALLRLAVDALIQVETEAEGVKSAATAARGPRASTGVT